MFDPVLKPDVRNWFGSLGKGRARRYLEPIGAMVRGLQSCTAGLANLNADAFRRLKVDYQHDFRDAVIHAVAAQVETGCCHKLSCGADLAPENFMEMAPKVVAYLRQPGHLNSDLLAFLTSGKEDLKLFRESGEEEVVDVEEGRKGCCSKLCCCGPQGDDDRVRTGTVRGEEVPVPAGFGGSRAILMAPPSLSSHEGEMNVFSTGFVTENLGTSLAIESMSTADALGDMGTLPTAGEVRGMLGDELTLV